jgi:sugar phosphate permease
MVAVGNLGNLAATAPLALAVAAFGWRSSFLAIGIAQIVVTLLVFAIVRNRPDVTGEADETARSGQPAIGMLAAWREVFGRRDFLLLAVIAFAWYGNYLALQGLWGGPYLMQILHLSRATTGQILMFTSLGFICGSLVTDAIARRIFRSYKLTLLAGQMLLLTLMSGFLGIADTLPLPLLKAGFFAIGLAVSSGVMIYPIIRAMFPVRIVGTALTSLNFFVLMGAAVTQQIMGLIIGSFGQSGTQASPQAYHAAFLLPVSALAVAIVLYMFSRDYSNFQ